MSQAPDGGTLAVRYFYNDLGRVARISRPGLADELTFYDPLGRVIRHGFDLNGDHQLTATSTDRFKEITTEFQTNVSGSTSVVEVQTTKTYVADNDSSKFRHRSKSGCSVIRSKVIWPSFALMARTR